MAARPSPMQRLNEAELADVLQVCRNIRACLNFCV